MARINAQFGNSGKRYSIEVHNGDGIGVRPCSQDVAEAKAEARSLQTEKATAKVRLVDLYTGRNVKY